MTQWEVVIGIETHAQLSTVSKIFSGASTAFGAEPNTQASPVDLALPVGAKVPPRALQWLKAFAQQQGRPLLYTEQVREAGRFTGEQTVYGFGPPAFQEQAAQWSADGVPSW